MPVERLQRRLALVLVAAAFAAAAGAFLYAQVAKTTAAPITDTLLGDARFFSPNGDGVRDVARLRFRLRATQRIDADVIDPAGARIRRLVDGESRAGAVRLSWDGRDDAGRAAPDGSYFLRVRLFHDEQTITLPQDIVLDTVAPTIEAAPPAEAVLVPGVAGRDRVSFAATASEPVSMRLLVQRIGLDGRARRVFLERAPGQGRTRTLTWSGEVGSGKPASGRPDARLTPGSYVVGWTAADRAGNRVQAPAAFGPGKLAPAAVVRVETLAVTPDLELQSALPSPVTERLRVGPEPPPWPAADPQQPGLQAVRASAASYEAWAPAPVAGSATLVVVPTYSWALRNPYDADRDGYPDARTGAVSLAWPWDPATRGRLVRLGRVLAPVVEPGAYGAISDAELEREGPPPGTETLVLAHVRGWSDGLAERLRAFAEAGGRIVLRKSLLDRHVERDGDVLRLLDDGRVLELPQ